MSLGALGSGFDLSEEQLELQRLSRRIAEREFRGPALTWERSGEFPWRNMEILAQTGLLGTTVPEEYGGAGGSWLEATIVLEEIGRCCYVTAMAALGELGVQTQAIVAFGSEGHKRLYLPRVAAGELILAICITEPDVGSDVAAMTTTARLDGGDVVLDGHKMLISRADVAGLFLVYARFPDHRDPRRAIGAVLVERDIPGLAVDQSYETLGGEGLFGVALENVRVPRTQVLVEPDGGFERLLAAFNGQRCLNAAISLGIAQGAQDAAIAHARERVQGGRRIADHQGIRWMLADNAIEIEAARALIRRAAARASGGFPSRFEAAVAKTFANEMALRVTDRAMQVFGGHGWLRDLPAERYVRWARYGPLGGGTPQIQRNGIARHLLGGSDAAP